MNVSIIVCNALCTGCGACSGVCTRNAVKMVENIAGFVVAEVIENRCNGCGVCLEVCPSNAANLLECSNEDVFHGNYVAGYIGYAKDNELRMKSQSGGIVTALLCYLLKKKLIDGAIVNSFNRDKRRPEAILAKTKNEIIDGCGSYYTQTSVVKKYLDNSNAANLAAVVLGCHAESLHLLSEKYRGFKPPLYTIGLICAGQHSGLMIDDIIKMADPKVEDDVVQYFRFRDKRVGGWPGDVSIVTNKKSYAISKKKRLFLKPVYESHRCISCFDQMNIYSDLVCGDPWHIEGRQKEGYTVVIARNEKGRKLLEDAYRDGSIVIEPLSVDAIFRGQTVDSRHKIKFVVTKEAYQKNKWLYPYSSNMFSRGVGVSAKKSDQLSVCRRLIYSRALFFEKNSDKLKGIISRKKLQISLENCFSYLLRMPRYLVRFFIDKLMLVPSRKSRSV